MFREKGRNRNLMDDEDKRKERLISRKVQRSFVHLKTCTSFRCKSMIQRRGVPVNRAKEKARKEYYGFY